MSYANTLNIKQLVVAMNLALLTLMAYFMVSILYQCVDIQVRGGETFAAPGAKTPGRIESRSVQTVAYYNPIIARDLFKVDKTAQAPDTPPADLENLKETDLKLKLWGTVSGDADKAYAVIEDGQKREQNLYRVGDTIQNATVKMILREKVILSVNGKDEILAMEELDKAGGSSAMAGRRSGRVPSASMSRSAREQRITIERTMIDEAFQDVNRLMTDIAVTPHMEGGRVEGLNLNRIQPNSIFRRMGLRNGDVLMGVNGQPILTVEDAMQMYNNLRTSEEVQLQLKRRGQERTINYNIR